MATFGLAIAAAAGMGRAQSLGVVPQLGGGIGGNSSSFIAGYGQFVIGDSDSMNTSGQAIAEGYRFDRFLGAPGLLGTGALAAAPFESHATGICADGAFLVGTSLLPVTMGAQSGNQPRAMFWSQFGGAYNIGIAGAPPGELGASYAYALSGDGGTTVGATTTASSGVLRAFRWQGVISVLPVLGTDGPSIARAVSFNGAVIVGESDGLPFRWGNTGGVGTTTQIPGLEGAPDELGVALGMNTTGSVVVGSVTSPVWVDSSTGSAIPQRTAFKWTPFGTQDLGALPSSGSQFSEATGVSASGLVVVGKSRIAGTLAGGEQTEAFIWTPRWGMVPLASRLGHAMIPDTILTDATGLSYDGTVISGSARNTLNGETFAYVATILPYCPADHNDNGVVEVQDIFDFLNDWLAGVRGADENGNGVVEVQDIFDYLGNWFAGC